MNDFTAELAKLHLLTGAEFSRQVERIALRKEFHPLETDENILSVGGEKSDDYQNLLLAARKAVEFGIKVYMLPNPKETRTPDFIFEKKGVFRAYDLKTVFGKSSVKGSLFDSIGQCNRILLNIQVDYSTRSLAIAIRQYFEVNKKRLKCLCSRGVGIFRLLESLQCVLTIWFYSRKLMNDKNHPEGWFLKWSSYRDVSLHRRCLLKVLPPRDSARIARTNVLTVQR